jgi:hypothetical protein
MEHYAYHRQKHRYVAQSVLPRFAKIRCGKPYGKGENEGKRDKEHLGEREWDKIRQVGENFAEKLRYIFIEKVRKALADDKRN